MMEWKEKLKVHLVEEGRDHSEYLDLAGMAERDGCHEAAAILRDIAHDEHTHHRFIEEMMHE